MLLGVPLKAEFLAVAFGTLHIAVAVGGHLKVEYLLMICFGVYEWIISFSPKK